MGREENCEARISAHMDSREEDYLRLFAIADAEEVDCAMCDGTGESSPDVECSQCDGIGTTVVREYEGEPISSDDASDRLSELPLGVSVKRVLRIDLSTGGPGDWLEADLDDDGTVDAVAYHFNDWFDHAERSVSEGSALWRAAEYYAEYVTVDR